MDAPFSSSFSAARWASAAAGPGGGGGASFAPFHAEAPVGKAARAGSASGAASSASHENEGHFSVVIRIRPPLQRELESPAWHHAVAVQQGHAQVTLQEIVPEPSAADRACGSAQVVNHHTFAFDHVFDQGSSQPEVYEGTARESVASVLQGYNATVLAYGPTGTGKTYTMEGCRLIGPGSDARGIIPRSMEDVFQHIRQCRDPRRRFLVRASYLQIYNEVISDLLKPDRTNLMIREDKRRGIFIDGLSEWLCRSPAEVQTLMGHGSAARATAQTNANDVSSRSHAVFMVVVEQSEAGTAGESELAAGPADHGAWQAVRVGRLNLVDLAGSERPRLTGATGQRLEETKKINQSLSALGNVISALTERRARQHIPYRDSKLTRLLEDSLGGNCRTTMMAMVSPAAESFAESLCTLKFAHRAKAIRNSPRLNEDVDHRTMLRRYETEVRRLRAELKESQDVRESQLQLLQQHEVYEVCDDAGFAEEQERARAEQELRLSDMESQRCSLEEDKAQVARYKQLLLKQREIMIALTQRLQERDEAILALQAEVDIRDRNLAELRWQAQQVPTGAGASRGVAGLGASVAPAQPRHYPPESAFLDLYSRERQHHPLQLLSADEKIAELAAMIHGQRQENHCLRLELEDLHLEHGGRGLARVAGTCSAKDEEEEEDEDAEEYEDGAGVPTDIVARGAAGQWGGFQDAGAVAKKIEEDVRLREDEVARQREEERAVEGEERETKERVTSLFHGNKETDYAGRSWIENKASLATKDVDDKQCFLPKKWLYTWSGHTMGVNQIRWFPESAHLLLSASMDGTVKIWDFQNQRKCLRTYMGHDQGVRDVNFTADGKRFYSVSYDKNIQYWDTETGQVIATFTNKKTNFCVAVHPDPSQQNVIITGCSNKKAVQWDSNTASIVQEYDEHMGAVNTVTFCEDGKRLLTTSDDKKIFVWEYGIPVVVKYIAEPTMHSVPAVALCPRKKMLIGQSMDNKIITYEAFGRFKFQGKRQFKGHLNAGYAITPGFSADGKWVMSGDLDGKLWFWDWQKMKNYRVLKAHDGVVMSCMWHPTMPSRVVSCGWDGTIKLWD
mmetsp:Transcript_91920/g.259042  ORF Transcript_91920/g.259042 Transcript_91920/m.259042 type:complete len:1077 (-) Transcript_91920:62-3292(-)